jgi:hypothetical protein
MYGKNMALQPMQQNSQYVCNVTISCVRIFGPGPFTDGHETYSNVATICYCSQLCKYYGMSLLLTRPVKTFLGRISYVYHVAVDSVKFTGHNHLKSSPCRNIL